MQVNQKVGRLTLLEPVKEGPSKKWRCRCDCGTTKTILHNSLQQRLTLSCGCLRREIKSRAMARVFSRGGAA